MFWYMTHHSTVHPSFSWRFFEICYLPWFSLDLWLKHHHLLMQDGTYNIHINVLQLVVKVQQHSIKLAIFILIFNSFHNFITPLQSSLISNTNTYIQVHISAMKLHAPSLQRSELTKWCGFEPRYWRGQADSRPRCLSRWSPRGYCSFWPPGTPSCCTAGIAHPWRTPTYVWLFLDWWTQQPIARIHTM